MTTAKQPRLVSIRKSHLDSLEATIETLENKYVMDHSWKRARGYTEGKS